MTNSTIRLLTPAITIVLMCTILGWTKVNFEIALMGSFIADVTHDVLKLIQRYVYEKEE